MLHLKKLLLCVLFVNGVFGVDGDEVESVSVMEGDSVTLHTNLTEKQHIDFYQRILDSQETFSRIYWIAALMTFILLLVAPIAVIYCNRNQQTEKEIQEAEPIKMIHISNTTEPDSVKVTVLLVSNGVIHPD